MQRCSLTSSSGGKPDTWLHATLHKQEWSRGPAPIPAVPVAYPDDCREQPMHPPTGCAFRAGHRQALRGRLSNPQLSFTAKEASHRGPWPKLSR